MRMLTAVVVMVKDNDATPIKLFSLKSSQRECWMTARGLQRMMIMIIIIIIVASWSCGGGGDHRIGDHHHHASYCCHVSSPEVFQCDCRMTETGPVSAPCTGPVDAGAISRHCWDSSVIGQPFVGWLIGWFVNSTANGRSIQPEQWFVDSVGTLKYDGGPTFVGVKETGFRR